MMGDLGVLPPLAPMRPRYPIGFTTFRLEAVRALQKARRELSHGTAPPRHQLRQVPGTGGDHGPAWFVLTR